MPDNAEALTQAAQRHACGARKQTQAAIRHLDRSGSPINFVAAATAAAVSRSLLYRDPDLRVAAQ